MITLLIENPLLAALYGWFVGNIYLLSKAKDPLDEEGKAWSFKAWWATHWDNALIMFVLIPFFVAANEWIFGLIFHNTLKMDLEYHPIFNGFVTPVYIILYKKARGK